MRNIALLLLLSCLAFGAGCSKDNDNRQSSRTDSVSSTPTDADNTARNDQKSPDGLASTDTGRDTAIDQGETDEDIKITSAIRKSVVNDKSLSTNAHNVKIITSSGKVTLRGPVKNQQEKSKIEAYAKMAHGVDSVDNMLEVEKNP
jgi:hyperosmotically inducible protein